MYSRLGGLGDEGSKSREGVKGERRDEGRRTSRGGILLDFEFFA